MDNRGRPKRVTQVSEKALLAVLHEGTREGMAIVTVALDIATGELDVSSNIKTGPEHVRKVLQEAADVVATSPEDRRPSPPEEGSDARSGRRHRPDSKSDPTD